MRPVESTFSVPDNLVGRCNRAYGWRMDYAVHVLQAYRQFMELKVQHEDWNDTLLSPPPIVERMWQQHLLNVQQYVDACKAYCKHIIGHDPGLDDALRREKLKTCQIFLRARFPANELDKDIWCMDDEDFSNKSRDAAIKEMSHKINNLLASHYGDKENDESDAVLRKMRGLVVEYLASKTARPPVVIPHHTIENQDHKQDPPAKPVPHHTIEDQENQSHPAESTTKHTTEIEKDNHDGHPAESKTTNKSQKRSKQKKGITLILKYPGREWTIYKVPMAAPFKKVFEHYAELYGSKIENLRFRYDGEKLSPHQSPEDWGMPGKNVVIDVSPKSNKPIELIMSDEFTEAQQNGCALW